MRIAKVISGPRPRHQEGGFATLIIIVILSLLLIYLMGNVRTLHYLGRDLRMVEVQQQRRLQRQAPVLVTTFQTAGFATATNSPSTNAAPSSPLR